MCNNLNMIIFSLKKEILKGFLKIKKMTRTTTLATVVGDLKTIFWGLMLTAPSIGMIREKMMIIIKSAQNPFSSAKDVYKEINA